ncbi:MAG: hypothetical protein QW753_04905 [Thermofilum sp.]
MSQVDAYLVLKALERDVEGVCLEVEAGNEVCEKVLSLVRIYLRRIEDRTISSFLRSYFRST